MRFELFDTFGATKEFGFNKRFAGFFQYLTSPKCFFHVAANDYRTVIGEKSFIGTNAVIGANVKICSGSVVGTLSFVNKDLTEPGIYVGTPVKMIKELK